MRNIAEVLQRGEAAMSDTVPSFLLTNEDATRYCRDILSNTNEHYAADTARANAFLRKLEWIEQHTFYPDGVIMEKFRKKRKLDPENIFFIYDWSARLFRDAYPRYEVMKSFCEKQLALRRDAIQRTMPQGQLVRLSYEEEGNHIPFHECYELRRDPSSNVWQLNGEEVPEEVALQVRQMAEQDKVYQCLSQYLDVPSKLSGPLVEGGPPAYTFRMEFEGGSFSICSDNQRPPESCRKILDYLKIIKSEKVKK